MDTEHEQTRVQIITRYQIVATGSHALTAEVVWGGHNHLHTSLRLSWFICGQNPDREVGDGELPESSWLGMVGG